MCNISVIIPAYNVEAYLPDAVASVLEQPYRNIHVIIVDDGSTDRTATLCDEMAVVDSRITVLHQKNAGVSCARNAGIDYALAHMEYPTGYIGFCDADDLWKPGCLTQEILETAENQGADILGFSCWCTDQEIKRYRVDNKYETHTERLPENGTVNWMLNGPFCAHLYRAEMLHRFHLRFPKNVQRNEDVIFMRQAVFCATCIAYREETLYLYRTNRNSVTHQTTDVTKTMLNICRAWYSMAHWAEILEVAPQSKEAWQKLCLSTAAAILLETARAMAESGYGSKHIFSVISGEPYFKAMDALVVENLAKWQQPDLVLFRMNFNNFCGKHQLRGIAKKIARLLLNVPFIRNERNKMRFPFAIED